MRNIQFRVWDVANNRMVTDPYQFAKAYGDMKLMAPWIFYETWQDVDDGIQRPCQVMQSTELRDGLGATIWEGDKVKRGKKLFIVEWISGAFHLTIGGETSGPLGFESKNGVCLKLKVVGHKFEK